MRWDRGDLEANQDDRKKALVSAATATKKSGEKGNSPKFERNQEVAKRKK